MYDSIKKYWINNNIQYLYSALFSTQSIVMRRILVLWDSVSIIIWVNHQFLIISFEAEATINSVFKMWLLNKLNSFCLNCICILCLIVYALSTSVSNVPQAHCLTDVKRDIYFRFLNCFHSVFFQSLNFKVADVKNCLQLEICRRDTRVRTFRKLREKKADEKKSYILNKTYFITSMLV